MRIDTNLVCEIWSHFGITDRADEFYGDSSEEPFVTARAVFSHMSYEARVPVSVIADYLHSNVSTTYSRIKSIRAKIERKDSDILNAIVCIRENLLK